MKYAVRTYLRAGGDAVHETYFRTRPAAEDRLAALRNQGKRVELVEINPQSGEKILERQPRP